MKCCLRCSAVTICAVVFLRWLLVAEVACAQTARLSPGSEDAIITITPKDPTSVQRGILAAYKAGEKKVIIPPGVYPVAALDTGSIHLKFEDMHDFEIEAHGATLVMADQTKGGVLFRRCRNIVFRGATIRNAIPPFTQGVIESVSLIRTSCDVRVDAGYPTMLDNAAYFKANNAFYLFDPKTRLLKEGSKDINCAGLERLGADRFRFHAKAFFRPDVAPGDRFAAPGSGGMGIVSEGCGGMTFEDLTVEYAGSFGFFELWGDGGNVYRRVTVQPGPKPVGATEQPLLSEPGDGIHSAAMRRGPTVEDSYLTRMGDDGIAIHGYFVTIRAAQGNKLTLSQGKHMNYFKPGDHMEAISKSGVPLGEALVVTAKLLADDTLPSLPGAFRALSENHCFSEIVLDHELPVSAGDFAETVDRLGSGFVLRHNTITDHRARGMMLKACDGLVENNYINGSSVSGIALIPQLWWGEAGFCRNVMIRGNTVAHVGYATVSPESRQAGAIAVVGELKTPEARGNRNITIKGNIIRDVNGVNIELDGVEGCLVEDNQFIHAQQSPTDRGADEVDTRTLIFINRAKDVRIANNIAQELGSANERTIKTTANAIDVKGIETGIGVDHKSR